MASDAIKKLEILIKKYGDKPLYGYCAKENQFYKLGKDAVRKRYAFKSRNKEHQWPDCIMIF